MNKKGEALPLNVVIVAILVVLVLIVVAVFFLGGTAGITSTIRQIFKGTTAGTDLNLAIETCKTRCSQSQMSTPSPDAFKNSAYCRSPFNIDTDGNGEAEFITAGEGRANRYKKFYCRGSTINVNCIVSDTVTQSLCDTQYSDD